MKYLKALERIENWLEKTGIRDYCKQDCKNHRCCYGFYCDGFCERPPLSCSIFLCDDLKRLLGLDLHQGEEFRRNCQKIWRLIKGRCHIPEEIKQNLDLIIPDRLVYSIIMNNVSLQKG